VVEILNSKSKNQSILDSSVLNYFFKDVKCYKYITPNQKISLFLGSSILNYFFKDVKCYKYIS